MPSPKSAKSAILLLLLAALCFAGGYLSSRYARAPGVMQRADVARLQTLVHTAEATAAREANAVAAALARPGFGFQPLLAHTTFPTYVLQNGQLKYWSDAMLRPEAEATTGTAAEQLVETPVGQFLLLRRPAKDFLVLTYLPLVRHYRISNRYLRAGDEQALFRGLDVQVVADSTAAGLPHFKAKNGRYLFSIMRQQPNPLTGQYLPLGLLALGIVCYVLGCWHLARRWWRAGRAGAAVAVGLGPLLVLRVALLYLGLPYSFIELPLFDPRIYAASWLAPSLGDLLVNALLALLAAVAGAALWRRWGVLARVVAPRSRGGQLLAAGGVGVVFAALLVLLFTYYLATFGNAELSLDITRNIQVTGFRMVLALAALLHTGAYLVVFFGLTQLAGAVLRHAPGRAVLLGPGTVALVLLAVGLGTGQAWVLLAGVLFLFGALVRAVGLRAEPSAGSYQAAVLGGLLLALVSATGALALYQHFGRQLLLDKQRLAGNLLVDNDLQGEFLLAERLHGIAADPFLRRALAGPFGQPEAARRRVARQYLSDYFDKYESQITFYDAAGQPQGTPAEASTQPLPLAAALAALRRSATPTDQPGVYLVRAANSFGSRRYVALAAVGGPVPGGMGPALGTVWVELTLKKLSAYSVLPELLVDQNFFQPGLATQLSYAGFDHGQLASGEGDFDYANLFPPARLANPRLYTDGLVLAGFHHLAVRGSRGRTVVVTTAPYSLADGLANFSFQFLLAAVFWAVLATLAALLRGPARRRWQLNFSTRIQLLLNVGIVVPLLVVSVATTSQLIASYQRDLARTYERRGQLALESLRQRQTLLTDTTSRVRLAALVRTVATLTETDLNLYDAKGELLASSQPLIFEAGLLGPLLNPRAVVALQEHNKTRALLTEQAGSLSFNALYVPIYAGLVDWRIGGLADNPDSAALPTRQPTNPPIHQSTNPPTHHLLGYVGIPFFDSEKELNTKLTELFTTILNIFTGLFLLFLGLAFAATRQLTAPLKLLTEKLTHTTLTGNNELLDYRSTDDEIGLLVREYNTMLTNLEASRRALAAQEKEAAWREMARQVAHEIKNPLTPMKLSLQFLQKAIAERRANAEELISRIAQTLITQIDVLSDIATSFSTFTNLPAMRPERLDVAAVLRGCAALHQPDTQDGALDLQLPADADTGRYVVFADENLLVRTFNNLLLNARQAVPEGRPPRLAVALAPAGAGRIQVSIRDNGEGIADEVRDKMFVPNFTTKDTGSGIGLAVAKRGIESAGGRIWFETVVGEGTVFFIELPLAG